MLMLPGLDVQLEMAPDYRTLIEPVSNPVKAAVLIYLFPDKLQKLHLVLMKRPAYDGHHSGQISFPGGKYEDSDKNMAETALRESHEEIGIDLNSTEIIGTLTNLYIPVSSYLVYPFVAFTPTTPVFKIDPAEVDYLITTSIDEMISLQPKSTLMSFRGKDFRVPYFEISGETVWGATAMILNEFQYIVKKMA